jgi:hypothetical protein
MALRLVLISVVTRAMSENIVGTPRFFKDGAYRFGTALPYSEGTCGFPQVIEFDTTLHQGEVTYKWFSGLL